MKNLRLLLIPVLALLGSGALTSFHPADGQVKSARSVREVPAFTRLSLSTSARLVLRQGSPQRVEVEASAADQQWVETTVKNDRLRIGTKKDASVVPWHKFEGPVVIYVTMPNVTGLSVDGSGDMKAETDLKANKLDVAVNGSGQMELPGVQASELETAVNGSGNLLLGGNCPRHETIINGSGAVKAGKLRTERTEVSIHGSGDAYVFATKAVQASLVGSGDVFVAGGAEVNSSSVGSGKVHKE
jgi:hypothetical protein